MLGCWRVRTGARSIYRPFARASFAALLYAALFSSFGATALALTPESPEVRKLVTSGLGFLEKASDERLGGKCVIGLAIYKSGDKDVTKDHPRVREAVRACQNTLKSKEAFIDERNSDIYSNGLAIIFLCELDPKEYKEEIKTYLVRLLDRQKPHGGWGYDYKETGDTSQTQYAVYACWEAHRVGITSPGAGEKVQKALDWLLKTQDPSGTWGYQGKIAESDEFRLVEQSQTSVSMHAAGVGIALMCSHVLGIQKAAVDDANGEEIALPPSVTPVTDIDITTARPLSGASDVDKEALGAAIDRAGRWISKNFTAKSSSWGVYYLYSVERYKSLQEVFDGVVEEEPEWYNAGVAELQQTQRNDGSWSAGCGESVDTAFAILFLIRSMRQSINADGEGGTMVGGRGLPGDIVSAQLRGGRLVSEEKMKSLEEMIQVLEDPDHPDHGRYLADPRSIDIQPGVAGASDVVRLQQLIRGGTPDVRLLAVRMLSRRRSLDDVPALLYAMTDPDPRVVLAARDGLRFVSRRIDGFGLPDEFSDNARFTAIERWKAWYLELRPSASTDF